MMKRIITSCFVLLAVVGGALAETWEQIQNSGKYYYGVGQAPTEEEADRMALAALVSQIATHVSSDFTQIDDVKAANDNVDHQTRVQSCVRTYSQATLTNTEKWPSEGKGSDVIVRRYMKKSELSRIFDNRIAKAKSMLATAEECLEDRKIDMALQYYYWAYSLIRSVQFPNEVKDDSGRTLIDRIPFKINEILSDVNVQLDRRNGDFVDLLFSYKGEPVSSLAFTYSDGRIDDCLGAAKGGIGTLEMIPGYETDVYHLTVEYEYKNMARGDAEMESVLSIITPKVFPAAAVKINARSATAGTSSLLEFMAMNSTGSAETTDDAHAAQAEAIKGFITAITNRSFIDAHRHFTLEGLDMFNRLNAYGKARVLDASNIRYYDAPGGNTVARGLKMSFTFDGRRKKTFVEDLSFTFNKDNKIDNVAFGLGDVAEKGIFESKAAWSDEIREIIVSFMENYKTAYSLERLDYISDIFADDAVIIVGNVVKRNTANARRDDGLVLSENGEEVIKYNHYTKKSYLENLSRCFNRNDFINLQFTSHQIQWLEKFDKQSVFAINIRQQYDSSTYADQGYLFLLVDMTDHDAPLIKVRTWQPNEVPIDQLYNAGDFFND